MYSILFRIFYVVTLIVAGLNLASTQTPSTDMDSLSFEEHNYEGLIKIYLGKWQPFGQLSEDFNSVFTFGASLGFNIKHNIRLEAKGQAMIKPDKAELVYKVQDQEVQTSDVTLINGGFRIIKEKRLEKSTFLDLGAELNLNIISLDMFDSSNSQDDPDNILMVGCAAGIGIKRILKPGFSIGIESYMHFTPYSWSPNMVSDTGMFSNITQAFFSVMLPL